MSRQFQNILLLNASATGAGTSLIGNDRETSTAIFAVTITGTATVTFQGSADGGITTYNIPVTSVTTSPSTSTTVTSSGIYRCDATGISVFPNVTSYSSGAITVVGSLERGTLSGGVASGGGGGGGAVTMASGAVASGAYAAGSIASGAAVSGAFADGAIVTIGANADAAVTGDTSGTVNAHLRGLTKVLTGDVWDSTDHGINVVLVKDATTSSGSKSTVAQVSVGTSATSIIAANTSRKSLAITNQGSATIYLGNSGVSTSSGFALAAGATISDVTTTDAWYGIVASSTVTAGVIEVS